MSSKIYDSPRSPGHICLFRSLSQPLPLLPNPFLSRAICLLSSTPRRRLDPVRCGRADLAALVLPLRNQTQLADLLHRLYTPGDVMYGKYLTRTSSSSSSPPPTPTMRPPSPSQQAHGLRVTGTHVNRTVLDVTGNARSVERAFSVQLHHYQAKGRAYLPRSEATTRRFPQKWQAISQALIGLDTAGVWANPQSGNAVRSRSRCGRPCHSGQSQPTPDRLRPGGGLTPSDIKTAYNLNGIQRHRRRTDIGSLRADRLHRQRHPRLRSLLQFAQCSPSKCSGGWLLGCSRQRRR